MAEKKSTSSLKTLILVDSLKASKFFTQGNPISFQVTHK